MSEPNRYYLAAEGFGWGVRDRRQGSHPTHVRVAYFSERDAGGWQAAQQQAQAECDRLNAAGSEES
jgi:hypothetical protein